MEETLTVLKLALPPELRRSLASTNIIESALSISRSVSCNVKRWREGNMKLRWCAAGLLHAENQFIKIRGYRLLHLLVHKLDKLTKEFDLKRKVA